MQILATVLAKEKIWQPRSQRTVNRTDSNRCGSKTSKSTFWLPATADPISLAFDIPIDKDTVRHVLTKHYRPDPRSSGPSWLTLLGHSKDNLWCADLFRCELLILDTHWVMVVMDQCTRRIIGFAVHKGTPDGPALCRMFDRILSGTAPPAYLSSDNDPFFEFQRWKANLRILEIEEIKTVPYVPMSHPFAARLTGTSRREYLDHVPLLNARDLARKLSCFQGYYNRECAHQGLGGNISESTRNEDDRKPVRLDNFHWKSCCRSLFQLPTAA